MRERVTDYILKTNVLKEVKEDFLIRLSEGGYSREENPESHFCVYFAFYDPKKDRVFVGHHKKSDLFLFTGGHVDMGELPVETLEREIFEELGFDWKFSEEITPSLFTITEINSKTVNCKSHYDIWYFFPSSEDNFNPDYSKLSEEFFRISWLDINQAIRLIKDPATKEALELIKGELKRD